MATLKQTDVKQNRTNVSHSCRSTLIPLKPGLCGLLYVCPDSTGASLRIICDDFNNGRPGPSSSGPRRPLPLKPPLEGPYSTETQQAKEQPKGEEQSEMHPYDNKLKCPALSETCGLVR